MFPIDDLAQHSLRKYGLIGTLLILGLIFAIVFWWKRPPPTPHASPMEAVKDHAKLIPMVLEEIRFVAREIKDLRRHLDHRLDMQDRHLDQIEERSERMERLGEVIKNRQHR